MQAHLQKILNSDIRNASGEIHPPVENLIDQICFYTSNEVDSHKANFLNTTHRDVPELLKLRIEVINGNYEKITPLLNKAEAKKCPEEKAEYLLIESLCLGHQGHWTETIRVTEEALKLNPITITQLSLLQCRAMALYECSHLQAAKFDCEIVLSQKDIYPNAVAVRYAEFLMTKILLQMGHLAEVAKREHAHWMNLKREDFNLDKLLTLLRLQIDIHRTKGAPIRSLALACRSIANSLGDPLYQALAEVDLYTSFAKPPKELTMSLQHWRKQFSKVDEILENLQTHQADSLSMQKIASTQWEPGHYWSREEIDHIVLGSQGLVIDLVEKKIHTLSKRTDWLSLCQVSEKGPSSRKDFFEAIWMQKFSYEIHDGVIRTFLHRLKKRTGVNGESREGIIHFPNTAFVASYSIADWL